MLAGAEQPEELTLLKETIRTDDNMPHSVANLFVQSGCRSIGVLGISYKGDIKVPRVSRSAQIATLLKEQGVEVGIHDPYFSSEEIESLWELDTFSFPGDLEQFDGLLVAADHREYSALHWDQMFKSLIQCKLVVDNLGVWQDVDFSRYSIRYTQPGDASWLQAVERDIVSS